MFCLAMNAFNSSTAALPAGTSISFAASPGFGASSSITVELAAMPEAKAKPRLPPSSDATQRS